MPIQHSTFNDAALAAKRTAYLARYRLKDFKLSGRSLMQMVRSRCCDKPLVDRVRKKFTTHYATDLKMEARTWDHLEMFGRDGHLVALVAHPYGISSEGRADMELFHRANLNVIEGGEVESWYGYHTSQIRVEHPCLAGKMLPPPAAKPPTKPVEHARPAPAALPSPAAIDRERRLRRHAPDLLVIAKAYAAGLVDALRLVPHTPVIAGVACIHCAMQDDLDRIYSVVSAVDGVDAAFVTEEGPLFDD